MTTTAHLTARGSRARRTLPATLAMLAGLALLLLTGCGTADPSGTTSSTTPPTTTATRPTDTDPTMTPPHDFPAAEQVTVRRSGGLKPQPAISVFAADRPAPDGFTRADVAAVLEAAADPALKQPLPPPGDTCCDRFVYRVSISYPDGTSTSFWTVDGAPMPAAVKHLINLAG